MIRSWSLPLTVASALLPVLAAAHPLGNLTTSRWARLHVDPQQLVVSYAVDFAELPSVRELRAIDTDGDGTLAPAERDAWLTATGARLAGGLTVTVDEVRLPLTPGLVSLETAAGAAGLRTLRVDLELRAPLPDRPGTLAFRDDNFPGRPGWAEVVAVPGNGVAFDAPSVSATDRSRALRAYPQDLLAAPPQVTAATLRFVPSANAPGRAPADPAGASSPGRSDDRLAGLVATRAPLTPGLIAFSLLVAAALGAFHALGPGHGKTVVGAYLVGSRGTAADAVFLGLVVTATHTLGVYALGLVTLTASHWIVPERLFPWISMLSGLIVVGIGATLMAARLGSATDHPHVHPHGPHDHHHHHDHDDHAHDHHHQVPDSSEVSWRRLLALGVSGGLLPCPSALVVMLGAIALGRVAFGLGLIVAFSAGLAAVLTGIGLAMVYARGFLDQLPFDGRIVRYLPVASAVVISMAGLLIVAQALAQIGV